MHGLYLCPQLQEFSYTTLDAFHAVSLALTLHTCMTYYIVPILEWRGPWTQFWCCACCSQSCDPHQTGCSCVLRTWKIKGWSTSSVCVGDPRIRTVTRSFPLTTPTMWSVACCPASSTYKDRAIPQGERRVREEENLTQVLQEKEYPFKSTWTQE